MASSDIVFVLWGERCDEEVAVAWVCRQRSEGKRVYLVAVSGRRNRGSYGVTLQPDVGLAEALEMAEQASLFVIPCRLDVLHGFRRDPRFDELLGLAAQHGARFLVHPSAQETVAGLVSDGVVQTL